MIKTKLMTKMNKNTKNNPSSKAELNTQQEAYYGAGKNKNILNFENLDFEFVSDLEIRISGFRRLVL